MKTKSEFIGTYVTYYNSKGFDVSFNVSEETAQDHEYYTSVGLGYLFEEEVKVSKKFKGVEPDANTEA
jgi:hypothetical protein